MSTYLVFKVSRVFISKFGQIFKIISSPNLSSIEFEQRSSTSMKHISITIEHMWTREYPLERRGSPLYLFYSTLGQNLGTIVPLLYVLTTGCGQVRFDVGTSSLSMMLQKLTSMFFYHFG
jgi:hypothetical protein